MPVTAQPAVAQPAATPSVREAEARATLMRMATFLGSAQAFSVTIDSAYDAVQDDGRKIEFGAVRRVLLSRPEFLRIETDNRDGTQRRLFFDGKSLTLFSPDAKVYASVARPGSVDQAIQYLLDTLRTPIPLSMLLMTTLPRELEQRITSIETVAEETLDGLAVTHLAARTDEIDFEAWIAKGNQPAPARLVLTYKDAKGEPQFRATLRDWNFNPVAEAAGFAFVPPKDAFAVAFMVPVPEQPAANPASTGKRR